MMREMSLQTDPQEMVRAYAQRITRLRPIDRRLSVSRRGLAAPYYRVTRSTTWSEDVNPWKEPQRLPVHAGGLLAELLYSDEPRVIDDLVVAEDDPAAEYLAGHRSLLAIPMYDQGEALNMVILLQRGPEGFPHEEVPDLVWRTNLFGRATSNLVLKDELQQALRALDREMQQVGELQGSLLPQRLPEIPGCNLAAYYQPSKRAGGDYYDFFPLPDGRWGFLIADVSGHGTPAAVLMAVTHALVHARSELLVDPARALTRLNEQLTRLYTNQILSFITAFYGVYDPRTRRLVYASAGHNPPRLKHCGAKELTSLADSHGLPLGVLENTAYEEAATQLLPGDLLVLYTDGITEAQNPHGELFGLDRLDRVLENCRADADELLQGVLTAVEGFSQGRAADDDRTLVLVKVS